jgi:asparagine synthase (glutamine-hydrolysing)
MSGLVAVVGCAEPATAARRMLSAAPHRGPEVELHGGARFAVGVQALPGGPPFTEPGMVVDWAMTAAVVGCLFRGDEIVSGRAAAQAVAAAWRAGGTAALARLRGAFAGVLVIEEGEMVVALRSQIGERPLFSRRAGEMLAFASEVKQLRALDAATPEVDAAVLLDHIAIDFDRAERTPWRSIERVRAATVMQFADGDAQLTRTWDPRSFAGTLELSVPDASGRFRELLRQAVARRLRSDTCVLMSGGIDSTAIAAEAAAIQRDRAGGPLAAVSALFGGHASADETEQIRATVRALGLRGLEVSPAPRPFRDVDDGMRLHDAPSVVAVPENVVALLDTAADAGFTCALDGNDGDSLFGPRTGIERALARRGAARVLVQHVARTHASGATWGRALRTHLLWPFMPARMTRAYLRLRGQRAEEELPAWITGPLRARLLNSHDPRGAPDWLEEQSAIYGGRLEVLLEVLERIGLSRSVTLLHPLADLDLVEFFLGLPPEVKFAGGLAKGLVRQSFPELPTDVSGRAYKPHFDDVSSAGADPSDLQAAVSAGPRALPGVDWEALEARGANGGVPGPEVAMIVRVLQADHLLGAR